MNLTYVKAVKVAEADVNQITLFFPKQDNQNQGVGLELAAPEAIALAYAILGVAQGTVDELIGTFQEQ